MSGRARIITTLVASLVVLGAADPGEPLGDQAAPASQQPFDAWGLREFLRQSGDDTFGGLYGGEVLTIAATQGNGSAISAAMGTFAASQGAAPTAETPRYRVVEVANSLNRLEALKSALLAAPNLAADSFVNMVDVDEASNTLLVGLNPDTPENRAIVQRTIGARPSEMSFERQDTITPVADRFNDVPPFNAGNRIWNQNSLGQCSSGFGVHQAGTLKDFLLTAAHCSKVAGQQDFFWNGPENYKRQTPMGYSHYVRFGANDWDTQLIAAESSNITWTATATRSRITNYYTPVERDAMKVINEGASSYPWESGALNMGAADICVDLAFAVWGAVRICHLWRALSPDRCPADYGDSGGPIVAYTGYGPLAVGQIVGRRCTPNERWVVFHAVGDMISKNPHRIPGGIRLNTTSNPG